MIKLYYYPGNASFAPHVLLRELDVPFTLSLVDRAGGENKQPACLKLNPNGTIPVLLDGSLVLYESAAICLHLADAHPQSELMPALGTHERAHACKWLIWLTNSLQAAILQYFYPERMVDADNSAGAAQVKAHAEAQVGALLGQVDQHLASHSGPWFMGERYCAVDPFAFMLCSLTRGFSDKRARDYPNIAPYLARMVERPAVRQTFEVEGIPAPWY